MGCLPLIYFEKYYIVGFGEKTMEESTLYLSDMPAFGDPE